MAASAFSSPGAPSTMRNCGRRRPRAMEVVENGTPGLGGLAAHVLHGEQHLLPVLAHTDDDEERDRGRLAVEPHSDHRAVEDEPHDPLRRVAGVSTPVSRWSTWHIMTAGLLPRMRSSTNGWLARTSSTKPSLRYCRLHPSRLKL